MVEQRQHPRIHTRLDAVLSCDGRDAQGVVSNISPGGVMVRGDLRFKEQILPPESSIPQQLVEVDLSCRFPGERVPFSARCRLVYVRRLAQNAFEIGFRFLSMSEPMAAMLHHFIFNERPKVVHIDLKRNLP